MIVQWIHRTNVILSCVRNDQTASTVAWHRLLTLLTLPSDHVQFFSTSAPHKSAQAARRKQLISQVFGRIEVRTAQMVPNSEAASDTPDSLRANVADLEGGDARSPLAVEPLNISPFRWSPMVASSASPLREVPPLTFTLPSPADVSPQLLHSWVLWCSCCRHSQGTLTKVIVLSLNAALEVLVPQDKSIANARDAPTQIKNLTIHD